MSYLLLLALPIIIILYFQTRRPKHGNKLRPPGPPGLPFIGNLHQIDSQSPHTYLRRLSKKYGPVMSLDLGSRPVVVVSSADALSEVMSQDLTFSSRPRLVSLRRLSYDGLDVAFSPYNDMWREMKKFAVIHLFSAKKIESFIPIFKDEMSRMIGNIAADASSSSITNLSETVTSFAINTIYTVAFGKSYGDEDYNEKRFNRFFHVLRETQEAVAGFFVEDYLPWFRFIDRLTGLRGTLEKNFSDLDSSYEELIEEHMNPNRPQSMEGDVLDTLLKIKRDNSSPFPLTFNHIKALLANIINGGSDTVSTVPVWVLTSLMKNPQSMKKVQAEIRGLAGEKAIIDEHDIEKLPYLRAVIRETMRLFPPAPLLVPRETREKCSIKGYEIEEGSIVYINAWAIARDSNTWENAEDFIPERFLDSKIDVRGLNPEVTPFGFGRRRCPAVGMGLCEVELVVANLLYKFNWKLPPGMKEEDIDTEPLPGIVMHKKNALCLVAKIA